MQRGPVKNGLLCWPPCPVEGRMSAQKALEEKFLPKFFLQKSPPPNISRGKVLSALWSSFEPYPPSPPQQPHPAPPWAPPPLQHRSFHASVSWCPLAHIHLLAGLSGGPRWIVLCPRADLRGGGGGGGLKGVRARGREFAHVLRCPNFPVDRKVLVPVN